MDCSQVKYKRFYHMIYDSRKRGKVTPTLEQLEVMLAKLIDMKCPHCNITMVWTMKDSAKSVITIQHYKNGEMGLICATCNKRLAFEDDALAIPEGYKRCSKCKQTLGKDNFTRDSRSRDGKLSVCKKCRYEQYNNWAMINRNHINEYRKRKGF